MDVNDAVAGADALKAFGQLVGLQFEHMAETLDAIRDQGKERAEADARWREKSHESWQQDHDTLADLSHGLRGVRADLKAQIERQDLRFEAIEERVGKVEGEQVTVRSDGRRWAGITALVVIALIVVGYIITGQLPAIP